MACVGLAYYAGLVCDAWPFLQLQLQRPPPLSAHASPPPHPVPDHTIGGGGLGTPDAWPYMLRVCSYVLWCCVPCLDSMYCLAVMYQTADIQYQQAIHVSLPVTMMRFVSVSACVCRFRRADMEPIERPCLLLLRFADATEIAKAAASTL